MPTARLPDGTFVATTYGYREEGAQPFIVSVRITVDELDKHAAAAVRPGLPASDPGSR